MEDLTHPTTARSGTGFKPRSTRQSLSSLPSSTASFNGAPNKENSTSTFMDSPAASTRSGGASRASASSGMGGRRKRAQSLGGVGIESIKKTKTGEEVLSPGKVLRRNLAPRRSILKTTRAIFDGTNDKDFDVTGNTTTFNYLQQTRQQLQSAGHTTDLSNLSTQPFTNSGRRSSVKPAGAVEGASSSDEDDEDGEADMDLTMGMGDEERRKSMARRVSFAPSAHMRQFYKDKPTDLALAERQQKQDDLDNQSFSSLSSSSSSFSSDPAEGNSEEDNSANDISTLSEESMEMAGDEVTRAFANHYRGTVPLSIYAQDAVDNQLVAEEERLEASLRVDENDDDEEDMDGEVSMEQVDTGIITTAFANDPAIQSRVQAVVASKPKPRHSEVVRQEDAEDEAILRSLGMQKGGGVTFGASARGGSAAGEDDDFSGEEGDTVDEGGEQTMDMTMAVGSVLPTAAAQSVGFAGVSDDEDSEDSDVEMGEQTMEIDHTAAMQEATTYGGIISSGVPTPSTPSARLQAQLFARQTSSITASGNRSPIKAGIASAPHNSPRRSMLPLGTASAAKSPRKIPLLLSSAHKPSPGKFLFNVKNTSASLPATPTREVARGSPSKLAPTPKFTATLSNLRSPGGSLSLEGLLHEQQSARSATRQSGVETPRTRALMSNNRQWENSPRNQLQELKSSGKKDSQRREEDSTESSFGGYGEEDLPAPITSLDAFFDATGTGFMKDILGMTGVDLNRRKSIAPQKSSREGSRPPTFADLAVAGGSKSLFHQLYQSDQARLQEDIHGVIQSLAEYDEALRGDEQPKVFGEWSAASEGRKAVMQSQFRMIKAHYYLVGRIDWNEYRSSNHQSIINVMEENLEGLRADNATVQSTNFQEVLPSLKERSDALRMELLEERNRDLELSACDQDELAELHSAISEQTTQLEMQDRQYAEVAGQLAQYQVQEQELSAKLAAIMLEKEGLQRMLEDGRCFTKAEVLRLKSEYEALQYLHGWELVNFNNSAVHLRHLDQLDVTLTLDARGSVKTAQCSLVENNVDLKGVKLEVTRFLLDKVISNVEWALAQPSAEGKGRHARSILNRISSLWTGARRLRNEISLANLMFPTTATFCPREDESSLDALILGVEVHVPSAKATFDILLELNGEELVDGEDDKREAKGSTSVVMGIGCDVINKLGDVDCESIKYAIRERLDAGGCHALAEACSEAERSVGRRG